MTASAGSNTLTGLIPVIYEALDVVPRELVGAIGAVQMDPSQEMAGLNQTVRSHVVATASNIDVSPGVTNSNGSGETVGFVDLSITKVRNSPILWSGEEQLLLKEQYAGIVRDQFAQRFRSLVNEMENDVVTALAKGASRANGTSGTTPFATATDMTDFSLANKILDDNGAPTAGRSLILGTAAKANIQGKQTILTKVNESGTDSLLRTGGFDPVFGLNLRFSGQIKTGAVVGTGSSYVLNGAHAVGATTITVKTGSGTILAGDVVTIDTVKYVVATALSSTTFTINAPGLVSAGSDGDTVTVNAASVKNLAIQKNGFVLATRLPAMPQGGDSASDLMVVTDPVSGISFQVALYRQYRQVTIDVAAAWGFKQIRSDYTGLILG
jgi:hypothetical protein